MASFGPAISPVPPGAGRKFCRGQETTPTGTAAASADWPASQPNMVGGKSEKRKKWVEMC